MRFILLFSFLILVSCRTIKTTEPDYIEATKKYIPRSSFIGLPVQIPLKAIEDKLNNQFNGLIYNDESYTTPTNDDIKIKVHIKNRILLTAAGNELNFKIPLSIWAKGRWSPCKICPDLEKELSFDIDVFLESKFEIKKNYQFIMTTQSKGFEWTKEPTLFMIPVGKILQSTIQNKLKEIAKEMDKSVSSDFNLREKINNLWESIHEPYLIDDSSNTWLKLTPVSLNLEPILIDKENIRMRIGLESFIETSTGQKPAETSRKSLPDLILKTLPSGNFNINVKSVLGYKEVTTMVRSSMLEREFSYKRKKVKITDIELFGRGDQVYIRLKLTGSLKGEIYLNGIPVFDSTKNILYFEKLDYNIKTRNILAKSADWLFNSMLQKKMQENLRFSFDPEVKGIQQKLGNTLNNFSYNNLFIIKGKLQEFKVRDIYLTGDSFEIISNASGKADLLIKKIDF